MYNLGQQFIFDKAKSKAKDSSIFQGKYYRITILSERLVRIEYNKEGIFEDRPTQLAIFRDFDTPKIEVKQDSKFLEITSRYFRLIYNKEGDIKSASNLKIHLESTNRVWYYSNPEVRKIDAIGDSLENTKSIKYKKGLYSLDGFASLDDSKSLVILEDGTFEKRENSTDIYVFFYRKDFNLCLKDYFMLTGSPSFLPRYAFGIWWSKYNAYSERDINKLSLRFEKEELPMSILLLDRDWHIRNVLDNKDLNTGFSFNKQLFPTPQTMINTMHNKGIRVGLTIDPSEGILQHEDMYSKAIEYIKIEDGKVIPYAPFDPLFMDVYLKLFLHTLEAFGVDFFASYLNSKEEDINFFDTHYLYLDSSRLEHRRGMLISRPTNVAPHRYGVLYSGNTKVTWNTLKAIPEYNSNAANIGVSWFSHDIGG